MSVCSELILAKWSETGRFYADQVPGYETCLLSKICATRATHNHGVSTTARVGQVESDR